MNENVTDADEMDEMVERAWALISSESGSPNYISKSNIRYLLKAALTKD